MTDVNRFSTHSIASKFRLSYIIFTILLCSGFIGIFHIAENAVEKQLVKSRLLQQFQFNLEKREIDKHWDGAQINKNSGISIYPFEFAPSNLQSTATTEVQELGIKQNNQTSELHFFKHSYQDQDYILTYAENEDMDVNEYPVLAIFEDLEAIFYKALYGVIAISILTALLFSYLSSKAIIKPILDLKKAVETDSQQLSDLPNLPSELELLAKTIDQKNQQLSQYLAREKLFTGHVSHELRTPLTIIMGAAEVLESQLEPDSKLLEFSNRINNTAKETSDMISALLLLSRAPETLDSPKTSINDVVNKEVDRLKYLIRFKPVICTVESDKEYFAFVRPELLKMAVGNLIKNAFQYTDEGKVTILINSEAITVKDTGLGIPEDMIPVVYERFGRIETQGVSVEGTGLGLSIVQRVMSHLGWKLSYQANESNGSTFRIIYHQANVN